MPEEFALQFDNRLSDHLHAERLFRSHSFFAKIDKIVATGLVAFGIWAVISVGIRWWTILPFALAIVEWFDLLSIGPLQIWIAFRTNPKFKEKYSLTFSDERIHFKTNTVDSKLEWTHYKSFYESSRIILLVYGTRMYSVIPKSAFRDEQEIGLFRNLLQKKVGSD